MQTQRLLYISPVVPALSGNGLAMRAGTVLEALSDFVDLSLLIVPLYTPVSADVPPHLARLCSGVGTLPLPAAAHRWSEAHPILDAPRQRLPYANERFDIVHVFRAASIQFATSYLQPDTGPPPRRHLDLDDIESLTSQRVAALLRADGLETRAVAEEARGRASADQEDQIAAMFDRLYVCSADDRRRLLDRYPDAEIRVLPNAVRGRDTGSARRSDDSLTILFVGTLGYYPNVEALRFFCSSVLPDLRRRATRRVRVLAVGRGATDEVRALCMRSAVDLADAVADLEPYYRAADIAVVPVRAGGGTRIKVLEAFSYGVPVVSTSIGVEGIDARHDEHLLVADQPDAFVSACLRLANDPVLARHLSDSALTLVRNVYSLDAMRETIAAVYSPQRRSKSR